MGKLGLCCIHNGLKNRGFSFRTMTWKRFSYLGREKALPVLMQRYEDNLYLTSMIIEECGKRGWNYRVSSDILPLMTYSQASINFYQLSNNDTLHSHFYRCCAMARKYGIRLSCHPDQFNVLASENDKSVEQTIIELNHHGWFMRLMSFYSDFYLKGKTLEEGIVQDSKTYNPGYGSPINIHINCSKGNPKDIAKRFKANLDRLGEDAKKRLVVENEDKGIWHVRNLIDHIHDLTGIPITFDYLHHKCNSGGLTEKEAFNLCAQTWGKTRPLFHFAETLPGQKNPRKHADYPTHLPDNYGYDIDLDFEFKMKDFALEKAQKIEAALEITELSA